MATYQQPELRIMPEGSRSAPISPRDEKPPSFNEKVGELDGEKAARVHDSDHDHDAFGVEKLDPYVGLVSISVYEIEICYLQPRAVPD
jgi:hypothetical protein